jgi:hypothetical protein
MLCVAYFRPLRPNREEKPIAFRFYVMLHFAGGVALVVGGILALFGAAPPLSLRGHR